MQKKAFYNGGNGLGDPAGVRPRPADALEGSRLCGEESSSPDPESGEQWTPFGKVNLLLGGERTQGARNPALRYRPTFVCPCVCLRLSVFVCAGIASGPPPFEIFEDI